MTQPTGNAAFLADCQRIFDEWHRAARAFDIDAQVALYAPDATFETLLVQSTYPEAQTGVLQGHAALRAFFEAGARRPPNPLRRWYRTGKWLTDGERLLMWEYPRETPDGDQVDLMEVMEIADGLIQQHRVYWGWLGGGGLIKGAVARATA